MGVGENHEQSACGFFRTYIRSYQLNLKSP
nr:MAG TPA: hypothetical protein [Caudoviricetes sp.]DAS16411.1 MAG TPA: hypothetical protein [Caudoviricetes sp.]